MKIVTIIGARPQFIKAAAVSRAIAKKNKTLGQNKKIVERIIHTGQHYDANMSSIFFEELQIPVPHFNLNIGSGVHGDQTGKMIAGIERILMNETPDLVLVYGDTNSTMAGAIAAAMINISIAHIEAGLRSFNRRMPEEINRIVADKISNLLFCPTQTAIANLISEGLSLSQKEEPINANPQQCFLVGDVMYDSILFNSKLAYKKSNILGELQLRPQNYILATIHRAENTDRSKNLLSICDALNHIAQAGTPIILPLHPRTKKSLSNYNDTGEDAALIFHSNIKLVDPVGYIDMISLEQNARAIVTDSGGVQKEAFLLEIPCITLREETEWIETVHAGWNMLCGSNSLLVQNTWKRIENFDRTSSPFKEKNKDGRGIQASKNCFGDGQASEKIIDIIWNIFKS